MKSLICLVRGSHTLDLGDTPAKGRCSVCGRVFYWDNHSFRWNRPSRTWKSLWPL